MKIYKDEKFPIEFSDEEKNTFNEASRMLAKIIHCLEDNDLTTIENSSVREYLKLEDIQEMIDTLKSICTMDVAF